MNRSSPSVAESVADVSSALTPRAEEVSRDIYELILRDIPQLRGDRRVLLVLDASVRENVTTLLDIFQNGTDLKKVHAPAAAEEHARRLAQHGVPLPALLRAYRIGSARFQDWCLQELGRLINDVSLLSATGLILAEVTASYIDRISEEVVVAYETEKEDWLRNQSATRAARARALLRGEQVDVDSSEAILGYRLRQHHVGVVCWADKPPAGGGVLARLEAATAEVARLAGCEARPLFLPQDESSAWAWLPVGASRAIAVPPWDGTEPGPGPQAEVRFAFGTAAAGVAGFRRTHQQAIGAYSVALAAGNSAQLMTGFGEVAPLALMSGSIELIRAWVIEILGSLAYDDEQNARLRDTLGVFLQENGSFKGTGERLSLHKNTVQYRVHKAEEGLGGPVGDRRLNVELALLATKWLGAAVLVKPGEPLALQRVRFVVRSRLSAAMLPGLAGAGHGSAAFPRPDSGRARVSLLPYRLGLHLFWYAAPSSAAKMPAMSHFIYQNKCSLNGCGLRIPFGGQRHRPGRAVEPAYNGHPSAAPPQTSA